MIQAVVSCNNWNGSLLLIRFFIDYTLARCRLSDQNQVGKISKMNLQEEIILWFRSSLAPLARFWDRLRISKRSHPFLVLRSASASTPLQKLPTNRSLQASNKLGVMKAYFSLIYSLPN